MSLHNIATAPPWVKQSILAAPYVVVRREQGPSAPLADNIAIGVRGEGREMRWADTISPNCVAAVIPPVHLRLTSKVRAERVQKIPALGHLLRLQQKWRADERAWGPGGSVGFELASGRQTATVTSDLDIIVFAPEPFDKPYAANLLQSAQEISPQIDILIETPGFAFSLAEYATSKNTSILLRGPEGPYMGEPWGELCSGRREHLATGLK